MIKGISIVISIQFLISCHKLCNEPNHNFSVTESFYPETDSISIGDTLFLMCIIPKMEEDTETKMIVNFSNLGNLGDDLIISDISKFNMQRNAGDSFSYINVEGAIHSDQYDAKQLSFSETDSTYRLKVGLVALKAGLYIFTVPDALIYIGMDI